MRTTRVRFAPSPTGWLHVGGARTALFNWLFVKGQEGKIILRIEDTDLDRSQNKYVESIQENLRWLGLKWDEFYRQSDRLEIYRRYARKLIQEDKAYYCFCTEEELQEQRERAKEEGRPPVYDGRCRNLSESERKEFRNEGREPVIRFKLPEEKPSVTFQDIIKGEISFDRVMTGDFVILKSDGTPSYNFACTLDDHLMEISHVLRAEDHLSNTPKQIMLYRALDFELPEFGHMSMLLGEDHSKLSKRSGAASVKDFREEGYLPEAMVNHLAQLGWSSKDEREFFSMEQLIEEFSLDAIVDSPQVFDRDKLDWFNNHYIKEADLDRLIELSRPFLTDSEVLSEEPTEDELAKFREVLDLIRPSLNPLKDLQNHPDLLLFYGNVQLNDQAQAVLAEPSTEEVLTELRNHFEKRDKLSPEDVTSIVSEVKEKASVSYKEVYKPLRAAVTGRTSGPEIKEVIAILSPSETAKRIGGVL